MSNSTENSIEMESEMVTLGDSTVFESSTQFLTDESEMVTLGDSTQTPSTPDDDLTIGAIAGIVVVGVVGVVIIIIIIVCCLRRSKRHGQSARGMRPKSKKRWTNIWRRLTRHSSSPSNSPPSHDELDAERGSRPDNQVRINNAYVDEPDPDQRTSQTPIADEPAPIATEPIHMQLRNVHRRDDIETNNNSHLADPQNGGQEGSPSLYIEAYDHLNNMCDFEGPNVSPKGYIHMQGKPQQVGKKHCAANKTNSDFTDCVLPPSGHNLPNIHGYVNSGISKYPNATNNYENVKNWTQSEPNIAQASAAAEMTQLRHSDAANSNEYANILLSGGDRVVSKDSYIYLDTNEDNNTTSMQQDYYNKPYSSDYYNKMDIDNR